MTEREVIDGVLKAQNTRDHCLGYMRYINNINLNNLRSAGKFVDLVNGQIDAEATKLLANLRDERVPGKLESTNIARFGIDWIGREGMNSESHADYLAQFCDHFYKSITALVDRAMRKKSKFSNDPVFVEILQHLHMCEQMCRIFHGRESELDAIKRYVLVSGIRALGRVLIQALYVSGLFLNCAKSLKLNFLIPDRKNFAEFLLKFLNIYHCRAIRTFPSLCTAKAVAGKLPYWPGRPA